MDGTLARLNKRSVSGRVLKHEYGLFTVVGRDPDEDNLTDIIAIHGLNGHYENTWTAEREDGVRVNWLKDLLPRKLSNTRILSFSYNSRVQFSKSTSDIFDFASQLLVQLLAVRRTKAETARPIVFVCHSLGGIVFKEALAIANQEDRYYLKIAVHVAGVAFFGTPHRGSSLASWGGFLSTILKTGSFTTSTNTLLTRDLERNSRVLERISKSFNVHGKSLEIFSFYETEKMNFANCKVVETESATLGWPKETVIPIDGNHRSMCWFTHEDEPRFQPVWTSLECLVSKAASTSHLLAQDLTGDPAPDPDKMIWTRKNILSELRRCDYEQHKERNPTAVDGTCVWIFKHPKYQSWLAETGHSLLWVSADAGCGKSVLASFLVDHHKNHSASDINVCYFFFKADNIEQRNAVHGLSTLLHQLYISQNSLIRIAKEFLRGETPESGKEKLAHRATLWKLITDSTEDAEARPTICIIDGLDECEENSRKQLIQLIHGYYTLPKEDQKVQSGAQKKLKLLVTSRPDNSIKIAFDRQEELERTNSNRSVEARKNRTRFAIMRLRGEDETEAVGHDIELVIKDAMHEINAGGLPSDLLRYMEEELISRADRTFLWVALIIGLLRERVAEGASRREIDLILKSRSMDAIYAVLLNSNANQAKARKMLNIILAAVEPLTLEELSIALAVQPDHQTLRNSFQPRRPSRKTFEHVELYLAYPFENHIKGLCGHFVRIIQSKVYLVHQTATEFLLDRASQEDVLLEQDDELDDAMEEMRLLDGETTDYHSDSYFQKAENEVTTLASEDFGSAWQHTFSLFEAHAILLEICVTYLYMLGKTDKRPRSERSQPTPATSAFLKYAASSWGLHFRKVRDKIVAHNLPYYYGLCHPKFPGFESWLSKSSLPQKELSEVFSKELIEVSEDAVQDHVIRRLGLELEDEELRGSMKSLSGTESQLNSVKYPGWLSTNPAASENSYFPVGVDDTGFVSLRFGQKLQSCTHPARVGAQWREVLDFLDRQPRTFSTVY